MDTTAPTVAPTVVRPLVEPAAIRAYFTRFGRILVALRRLLAAELSALQRWEHDAMLTQIDMLAASLEALSYKYALGGFTANRTMPGDLEIAARDSGFPLFKEFIQLGQDAAADLASDAPPADDLRGLVLDHLLRQRIVPKDIRAALARRLYADRLAAGPLFLPRNPLSLSPAMRGSEDRRKFLAVWSCFDSTRNVPTVYSMMVEDSGRIPLDEDAERLEALRQHLAAQSMSMLKMVTIASGLDKDFPTLHPKVMKRISIGPLYVGGLTEHNDAMQAILQDVPKPDENGWVLGWTIETILSRETRRIRKGMFGDQLEEVWFVDQYRAETFEAGSSNVGRAMLLPYGAFQALAEQPGNPLRGVDRWVVADSGRILTDL